LLDLHERYKRKTLEETAQALSDDIPRLESELQAIDDQIFEAETKFLEQVAATVKHRSEVACTLSRARVCQHYVADPFGFQGSGELPADEAAREYAEVRRELEAAQRVLADTPEPSYDRTEALGDCDRWSALYAFELARDAVSRLLTQESKARKKAEGLGNSIRPLGGGSSFGGEPFAMSRRGTNREMVESV